MVRSCESMVSKVAMQDKLVDIEEIDTDDVGDDVEVDILDSAENETGANCTPAEWTQMQNSINGVRFNGNVPASTQCSDPDRLVKLRRQIANCNERRRMQSINAGFQALRNLLPRKEGEKLSKAAILQQTAELIHNLKSEMERLQCDEERDGMYLKRRKLSDPYSDDARTIIDQLQQALERERSLRVLYESQLAQFPLTRSPTIATSVVSSPDDNSRQEPDLANSVIQLRPLPPLPALTMNSSSNGNVSPDNNISVIRTTPVPPGTLDLSNSALLCSTASPLTASPVLTALQTIAGGQPPLSMMSSGVPKPPLATPITTPSSPPHQQPATPSKYQPHKSLHVILDAIKHLEGNAYQAPPTMTPTSHANVLVR